MREERIHHISPRGESVVKYFNPLCILRYLWPYRHLIAHLTRREVLARYKGSFIGLGWSFIQPLMMLCVYTFVFSVVFQARWGVTSDESRATFALTMFMGIITYNIFAEAVNIAPGLILNHINYVKKVVFPLEALPLVSFLSVLINALFSLTVLLIGLAATGHPIHWTVLLIPLIWLPVGMLSLGCSYLLASLGTFIRDIGATVGIITTMLFFMSPIFYPLTAIPENLRPFFQVNPIAIFVEDARRVALWGQLPDWSWYFSGLVVSILVFILGFVWFVKSKKAFADVI